MQRPLHDHEDAFGQLLREYLDGRPGEAVLERDDGHAGPALPAATFFAGTPTGPRRSGACSR